MTRLRVFSVVGARPQFIKASCLSRVLRQQHHEYLVHTGQHYDDMMSRVFFRELGIPEPDINLGVGSYSHARQTAEMMTKLEQLMEEQKPDVVLVYGDTNSTLAAALAAVKIHIPIAHVEAGLRSYNRTMPEEINRVLSDHISSWLFCPTNVAAHNLAKEGITDGVTVTGDIMVEAVLSNIERARQASTIFRQLVLNNQAPYALVTIHRPTNTDSVENLSEIMRALPQFEMPVIFPMHPRTRKVLDGLDWPMPESIRLIGPVGYIDMLVLLEAASVVLTDSGGLQKEAYVLQTPCVTVRPETEWVETLQTGWNRLVNPEQHAILAAVRDAIVSRPATHPAVYGDGRAAMRIMKVLEANWQRPPVSDAGQILNI